MKPQLILRNVLIASLMIFSLSGHAMANNLQVQSYRGDVGNLNNIWTLTTASKFNQDDYPLDAGALNVSGNEPEQTNIGTGLENYLGLADGSLDIDSFSAQAYEGSAMKLSFNLKAGDTLSFDYSFATRDVGASNIGKDYSFIVINGKLSTLSDVGKTTASHASSNDLASTGLTSFSFKADHTGNFDIYFGVVDIGDFNASSTLRLYGSQLVAAVPEPDTAILSLMGLGLVCLVRRQKRDV